ncbi:hypothetical protein HMPREF9093_02021 [Fusobacterium sp. oral taxon 370 str. F0437]|nr:hypothetical protein HMPREF9093_02021 [Fusobacterium sp. oral taxon 370 str. F0437]
MLPRQMCTSVIEAKKSLLQILNILHIPLYYFDFQDKVFDDLIIYYFKKKIKWHFILIIKRKTVVIKKIVLKKY